MFLASESWPDRAWAVIYRHKTLSDAGSQEQVRVKIFIFQDPVEHLENTFLPKATPNPYLSFAKEHNSKIGITGFEIFEVARLES